MSQSLPLHFMWLVLFSCRRLCLHGCVALKICWLGTRPRACWPAAWIGTPLYWTVSSPIDTKMKAGNRKNQRGGKGRKRRPAKKLAVATGGSWRPSNDHWGRRERERGRGRPLWPWRSGNLGRPPPTFPLLSSSSLSSSLSFSLPPFSRVFQIECLNRTGKPLIRFGMPWTALLGIVQQTLVAPSVSKMWPLILPFRV